MSPHRFNECLHHIRWTPINLAATFQCDRWWIEAWETGSEEVTAGLSVGRIDALKRPYRAICACPFRSSERTVFIFV
ncbi:hypothetical protein LJR239_005214 [Neorhizobium tomejilense]